MSDFTTGAHECFCDRQYKDTNKLASCGDCPRDYIAGAWDARRKYIEEHSKKADHYEEILDALAHEIWAAAQLAPGEGIVDGVARIEALLRRAIHSAITHCDTSAEGMEKALKDIRSLSSINSAMNPNSFALTVLLADIHHIADTALVKGDNND